MQKLRRKNITQHRNGRRHKQRQYKNVSHNRIDCFSVFSADGARQHRSRTDTDQNGDSVIDKRKRICNAYGAQRFIAHIASHENRIDKTVQTYNEHADNSRNAQLQHELKHISRSKLFSLISHFNNLPINSFGKTSVPEKPV